MNSDLFDAGIELFAEPFGVEVPEDDPAEDGRHSRVREVVDVQRVEVPDETTLKKCKSFDTLICLFYYITSFTRCTSCELGYFFAPLDKLWFLIFYVVE